MQDAHVLEHAQVWAEGELLIDATDAECARLIDRESVGDVPAAHEDGAGIGRGGTTQHTHESALSGAVVADDPDDLTDAHLQVGVGEGAGLTVPLSDTRQIDQR